MVNKKSIILFDIGIITNESHIHHGSSPFPATDPRVSDFPIVASLYASSTWPPAALRADSAMKNVLEEVPKATWEASTEWSLVTMGSWTRTHGWWLINGYCNGSYKPLVNHAIIAKNHGYIRNGIDFMIAIMVISWLYIMMVSDG